MNIKQEFIRPNQFTRPGISLRRVSAIAIHYTGDPGATAQNERDYFNGPCVSAGRYASCHYCVGMGGEIVQLIPENEYAYCTCEANAYSISIETCHPDSSGKFTEAGEKSLIELAASLCKKYGLNPAAGLIRHYDVTGKRCPLYYVDHPECWTAFKGAVAACMAGKTYALPCSGKTIEAAVHIDPYYTDTTILKCCPGQLYTFKTGGPVLCADGHSFAQVAHTMDGGYHLTTFKAVSLVDNVGFFVNKHRVCAGYIKQPYSDTTRKFKKRVGQTYTFKTDFPVICGTGSVFQPVSAEQKKGFYFTKFRAVGKGDAGFYCGSTRVCVGTVI